MVRSLFHYDYLLVVVVFILLDWSQFVDVHFLWNGRHYPLLSHVLDDLPGQLCQKLLCQHVRIELHISERHKLNDIPWHFLAFGSKQRSSISV